MSKNKRNLKISIEVNEKQAQLIINALDFYSRILCGQWSEVESVCRMNNKLNTKLNTKSMDSGQVIRDLLDNAKVLMFAGGLTKSSSYGIYQSGGEVVTSDAILAWDMLRSIRRELAPFRDIPKYSVDWDTPTSNTEHTLPKVCVEDTQKEIVNKKGNSK